MLIHASVSIGTVPKQPVPTGLQVSNRCRLREQAAGKDQRVTSTHHSRLTMLDIPAPSWLKGQAEPLRQQPLMKNLQGGAGCADAW
jgi:hypothetical protein